MKLKFLVLAVLWGVAATASGAAFPPITRAHSHNDYEHSHPLSDALSHGFWSVEADIWLTNGMLLVAHDLEKATPERTLETLYLNPLQQFLSTNRPTIAAAGPMTLLIDIKSDATNTWAVLRDVLGRYTNVLTRFDEKGIHSNTLTVVLSGNRPTDWVAATKANYAAIDGRLPDLEKNPPASLMPLVSDNWTKHFTWRGRGAMPANDRQKLTNIVAQAHAQGRRLRLWAAPDSPEAWRVLLDAGVDVINTDRLAEFETFWRAR